MLLAGAGRRIIIRFPDLTEGGNVLEISDTFHSGTMNIENVLCSATDLDYGQCNSAMFSVTVSDAPDVTGQRIYVYEAVDGYAYSVPLFTGKVKSAELQSDKSSRKIIAYDALHTYMDYDVTDWYKSLFPRSLKPEYAGAWNGNLVYTDPAVVLYDGVYYKYLCSSTDKITIAGTIYNVSQQIAGRTPAQLIYDSNFGAYLYRYSSYDPYEYEPITLGTIRAALIADLGLTQTQVTLPNDSLSINYQDTGKLTAGTVLKAIGQLSAAFGHMSPEGVFQWATLPSETVDYSGNIRSDTSYSEYTVSVPDGIAALAADGTELYKTAAGDNLWVMQNFLLYNADAQTALGNLVAHLPTFAYTPATVKAIISLPVELGAAIMFTTNTGATVTTYNLSESLSGVQLITQTMTAQGNVTRDNSSTIYDTVEALRARTQSIQSATDIAANYALINRNSAEAAAEAAGAAQATADGRANVYHQDTAPDSAEEDLKTGDTWFDTSNGYQVHRYAGTDQLTDENGGLLEDEEGNALFSEPWIEEPFCESAIAEEGVTTTHLATSAVTTDKICAGAVTADKIEAGTITANEIASYTITADEIAAGAITTDKLEANAVTADKIDVLDLFAQDITASGTITGATLIGADARITAGSIGGFVVTNTDTASSLGFNWDDGNYYYWCGLRQEGGAASQASGSIRMLEITRRPVAGGSWVSQSYIGSDGYFYSNNARISGEIHASTGTIGGFTIDSTGINNSKLHMYSDPNGVGIQLGNGSGTTSPVTAIDNDGFLTTNSRYMVSAGVEAGMEGVAAFDDVSGTDVLLKAGYDTGIVIDNASGNKVGFMLNNNENAGIYDYTNARWAFRYNVTDNKVYTPRGEITSSDERIKTIHRNLGDDHKKLFMALKPIEYSFKDDPDQKHFGLGAQTTEASMQKLGFGAEYGIVDRSFAEEGDEYGMNYTEALVLSIPVIQDQQREIESLREEVAELKAMIKEVVNGKY